MQKKQIPANLVPPPQARRAHGGSFRLTLLAAFAVVAVAAAAWWIMQSDADRSALRNQAGEALANWLDGTPLAKLSPFFRPEPPALPQELLHPPTAQGTLSGREIAATIAAPPDLGGELLQAREQDEKQPAEAGPENEVIFDQEPLAPVTEDSRVRPAYVAGLAQWLVRHYRPGQNGGIHAGVQALNQECGGRLASQAEGGRSGLLRYAFHPAMIQGLYNLYIPTFMADLDAAAAARGLTPTQNQQFHRSLAGGAALLASCLDGILRLPDLPGKLARIDELAKKAVDANADLTTAVFELDEQRGAGASRQTLNTAQMRVDGAAARYRRASEDHAKAQTALASEIRKYSGQNLDEDSLLFMAAWVARRYADGSQATGAIKSCIAVLRDLSGRCAKAGGSI